MSRLRLGVLACALGAVLSSPAAAQQKTVAVLPTLYFSAEPQSADNVTQGLTQQFEGQGYTVVPADRARSTAQTLGIQPNRHYSDAMALKFGKAIGADLVAYPRLLAVGIPYNEAAASGFAEPSAIILMRVINVHTGKAIYCRQIGHEFRAENAGGPYVLPQPIATATAEEVLQQYFQRVKGSKLEQ